MNTGGEVVLGVAVGYLVWATLAHRWYVANPVRANLRADLRDVVGLQKRASQDIPPERRLAASNAIDAVTEGTDRLERDLTSPGLWGDITWSSSLATDALGRISCAQAYVPDLLTDEEVTARLIVVRGWLSEYGTKAEFVALADRIGTELGHESPPPGQGTTTLVLHHLAHIQQARQQASPATARLRRALLGQALVATYARPGSPAEMIWHRKTAFILVMGLAAAVGLAQAVGVETILLFGAVGGLLQRLWQLVYERDERNSNPLFWSTLFLSPVAGALAAVGGLYLLTLLQDLNVFGSAFQAIALIPAKNPHPTTADLAVAFLLGFSAKFLGTLVARSENALTPPNP